MRANLEEMEKLAMDVQADTKEFVGVAGDVLSKKTASSKAPSTTASPSKL